MTPKTPTLHVRLARSDEDMRAAQRLRYSVFVTELGGDGEGVDHDNRLETDRFDPFFDHLLLIDDSRSAADLDHVVGVYRLMPGERAAAAGGFYTASEYDLAPLIATGRPLLELGRSCIHPQYRGGSSLFRMWQGLADYILTREIEILFGVASFHGTDIAALAAPLSLLHQTALAPPELRVRVRPDHGVSMDLIAPDRLDRRAAARAVPALIKSYLRLGGFVGEGAFVDHAFNTTDVCLVVDVARVDARSRARYGGEPGEGA